MATVVKMLQLVEQGTHDELIKNPNGSYSTLVKLQNAADAKKDDTTAEEKEEENVDPDEIPIVQSRKSVDSHTKYDILI